MITFLYGEGSRGAALYGLFLCCACLMGVSCTPGPDDVTVVAHRGAMNERPENTMAAFERAAEVGADIVEIDLRTSSDGEIFILHDRTLDRTTQSRGEASDKTLHELQQLDAGSWFDPAWSGARIPSFQQVLQWSSQQGVTLLLDLKEQGSDFADQVAAEVESYGEAEQMVVGVRSVEQAAEFRERLPDSRQLAFMGSPDEIESYAEAGVDVIRLWLEWLRDDPELEDRVHQAERLLMINGTDGEIDELREIMQYSPDWILIDDPLMLRLSLEELQR